MAKPYRENPLIHTDADVGLTITKGRTRSSEQLLESMVARFDDEFILQAAEEIGLEECVSYAEREGALSFDLTALQAVSLSCALAALAEVRDGKTRGK